MLCPTCGNNVNVNADSAFCPICGAPLSAQNQFNSTPTATSAEPFLVPTTTAPTTTAPTTTAPTTKKSFKLPVIIVAIILVLAIIVGVSSVALTSNPHVKVFNAVKNTVFDSSEIDIKVKVSYEDTDYRRNSYNKYDLSIVFGDDINSSILNFTESGSREYLEDEWYGDWEKSSWSYEYSIKNGKLYEEDEEEGTLSEYFEEFEEELEYYDINVDIEEEINNILNGKIDEKAVEKAYNEIIAPAIEDMFEEEFNESVELPKYDDIFGTATDLFKEKAVREAIELEKTKSDLPGTTYKYNLDLGDLAEAVLNYAIEDDQYREYLEIIAEEEDCDVDELVDEIVDEFNDIDDFTGTITFKSNRITNITIDVDDYCTIEIDIVSK